MSVPQFALGNRKLIWFLLAVMLVGGVFSFGELGKKEDAPFVIKSAVLVTSYPGATPSR